MANIKLIVGLGNPGKQYAKTRHNAGFNVLDILAGDSGWKNWKGSAEISVRPSIEKVILAKPSLFMNNSGAAVRALLDYHGISPEEMIVVSDDFSLELGLLRLRLKGSSGGHNGLESIIKALKTEAFVRIRIGTAAATAKGSAKLMHGDDKIEKFILGPFKPDELKALKKISAAAAEAARLVITESREKAMSIANAS